jgi:outer membrane protein assembly factor BamB
MSLAIGDDWPTFRNGIMRQGSTDEGISPSIESSWSYRAAAAPKMAWSAGEGRVIENQLIGNLTKYDAAIHPVVVGGLVYFGSSVDHHLHCLNLVDGSSKWVFATGGPIRLAPTVDGHRVYFGSDDGCVYCLSAEDGQLIWKRQVSSHSEWLLARGEMISRWPVRTGVLVDDGVAYFGAGIFPHEDIYLLAVDAKTGEILWQQDSVSSLDAGRNDLSPQGYLLATKDQLFVPSGRSLPAAIDRKTGALQFKRTHSWRTTAGGVVGGVHALLSDDQLYASGPHHWLAMDQKDGGVGFGWFAGRQIAVHRNEAFIATGQTVARLDRMAYAVNSRERHELEMLIYDAAKKITAEPNQAVALRKEIEKAQADIKKIAMVGIDWQQACEADACIMATDNHVFVGGKNRVVGFDRKSGDPTWEAQVPGEASGLVVANGCLLVSTDDGAIHCFPDRSLVNSQSKTQVANNTPLTEKRGSLEADHRLAEKVLSQSQATRGFCLVFGLATGRLVEAIARESELQIYVVEPDQAKAAAARQLFLAAGLYGNRITVHSFSDEHLPYANYFANLIFSESQLIDGVVAKLPSDWARHLKPLGGKAVWKANEKQLATKNEFQASLQPVSMDGNLQMDWTDGWLAMTRGALPGAGSWTHQYGNPSNTGVVSETRVKGGLGVLWYGDPGPGDMVNRHEGAVGPLATNGRLFVQGENSISAYDAYNGLFLWKHENKSALRTGVFQNQNPANLAANDERLFHFVKDECLELNTATGEVARIYRLPKTFDNGEFEWGYLATSGDYLFGAATIRQELEAKKRRRGKVTEDSTDTLFCIDLKTGQHLWQYQGQSISHHTIAISSDCLYFIDSSITADQRMELLLSDKTDLARLEGAAREAAEKRALATDVRQAVAIDSKTGTVKWVVPVDVTDCSDIGAGGGKLSLLYQNNVLILGGANANGHYWKQFVAGEFKQRRLVALSAADGHKLWARDANYKGRPITIGDRVLAEPWSYDLYTGKQQMRAHPLTGQEVPWSIMRTGHHCGVFTGCDSGMLLFRSGDTAFYDLNADVGAQHFAGHRLGCWINAIPANGLVMIPEASAGCVCQFSIAATIVMEPRAPRREWTIHSAVGVKTPIESLRINFGAPGDRKDKDGNLWLSYPRRKAYQETALDLALNLNVEFIEGGSYAETHEKNVDDSMADTPWLYSSSARGVKRFSLPLLGKRDPAGEYRLRLHFGQFTEREPSKAVFDVAVNGRKYFEGITIDGNQSDRPLVLNIPRVLCDGELTIDLVPIAGLPELCAMEAYRVPTED